MAERATLRSLIRAIAESVAGAQHEVERRQAAHLRSFFDDDLRPVRMPMRVPSTRADAAPGDEDLIEPALLSLLPPSPLRIAEAQVAFAVELGAVEGDDVLVALPETGGAPSAGARGLMANVVIRFREAEIPGGVDGLLAQLSKSRDASAD